MVKSVEQMRRRHGHAICSGFVIGFTALMPDDGRNAIEKGVQLRTATFGFEQLHYRLWMKPRRQAVDLVNIEDGIGLEHPASFIGPFAGIGRFDFLGIAFVENGDGRLLALADLPSQLSVVRTFGTTRCVD